MELACVCLNLRLRVAKPPQGQKGDGSGGPPSLLKDVAEGDKALATVLRVDPFFSTVGASKDGLEGVRLVEWTPLQDRVLTGIRSFTRSRRLGLQGSPNWTLHRCLHCGMDLFGMCDGRFDRIIVSTKALKDTEIAERERSSDYLPTFGFCLMDNAALAPPQTDAASKMDLTQEMVTASSKQERIMDSRNSGSNTSLSKLPSEDTTPGSGTGGERTSSESGDSLRNGAVFAAFLEPTDQLLRDSEAVRQIVGACRHFVRREQEEMDERIRAFLEAEQDRFDALRKRAKADRDRLLRELKNSASLRETLLELDGGVSGVQKERQNSGGGGSESGANDSAVPMSPVSLNSLNDPSPQQAQQPPPPASPVRPKAHSTGSWPLQSTGTTGQGGGSGAWSTGARTPLGGSAADEDNLFSFDEEVEGVDLLLEDRQRPPQTPGYADDEAETDDSGHGEDYVFRAMAEYPPAGGGKKRAGEAEQEAPQVVQLATNVTDTGHQEPASEEPERERGPGRASSASRPAPAGLQERTPGLGPLTKYGASVPVRIPPARNFWPPPDATESHRENAPPASSSEDEAADEFLNHRTVLAKRRSTGGLEGRRLAGHNRYTEMRALSQSMAPGDDPERLFGERPRRRYRTGETTEGRRRQHGGQQQSTGAAAAVPGAPPPRVIAPVPEHPPPTHPAEASLKIGFHVS